MNKRGLRYMNFPEELLYTKSHEWVKKEADGTVLIGLTDYAQHELGDLVFENMPESGDAVKAGEAFADVESVKAVSDVFSPVTGNIIEVNEDLADAPADINEKPYEAWFVKVGDITAHEDLLRAADYEAYTKTCVNE